MRKLLSLLGVAVLSGCAVNVPPGVLPASGVVQGAAGEVSGSPMPSTAKAVTRVGVAPDALVLEAGQSKGDLLPTVTYADGTRDANVVWSSSDERVATVEATTGRIQAVREGNVTILAASAIDPSKRASLQVSVRQGAVGEAFVELSPSAVNLAPKQTAQLSGRVQRSDGSGSPNLTWKSANEAVAVVSGAGLVTAVGVGDTTITATATGDATRNASVAVRVRADAAASN